jgi:putative N6-adenine-specific DNA methylase
MYHLTILCPPGSETFLLQELAATNYPYQITKQAKGRIEVSTPEFSMIYAINYSSRVAIRVLLHLATFDASSKDRFYQSAIAWPAENYLGPTLTFAIDAHLPKPTKTFTNSLYAAQLLKDVFCDRLQSKEIERPTVQVRDPDQQFHLYISQDRAIFSYDTSGSPLFKRGYRRAPNQVWLQEHLAAYLLLLSGLKSPSGSSSAEFKTFCDPCCGSGTFLLEAASILTRTPPGYFRKRWGFFHLPEYNEKTWNAVTAKYNAQIIPLQPDQIIGLDIDPKAIVDAQAAIQDTPWINGIYLYTMPFQHFPRSHQFDFIVADPPYGKRCKEDNLKKLHFDLYDFISAHTRPSAVACSGIITGYQEIYPSMERRCSSTVELLHGGELTRFFLLKPL